MPKVRKVSKLRSFVFTLNNYTDEVIQALNAYPCTYMTYGKEVGASGTPHLQGYCEIKQTRFTTVAKAFTWHIEVRRGSQEQAIKYCHKEDKSPYERGIKKQQGQRNDIVGLMDAVRTGTKEIDLFEEHPVTMFKYWKAANRYRSLCDQQDTSFEAIEVIVLIGEPGAGKSRKAREIDADLYEVPNNDCKWFDGYDGQETILLDDFSGQCDFRYLLKLLDGYKFSVPVKGGFTWKRWKKVIITTNMEPFHWYHGQNLEPLTRRISSTEIVPQKVGCSITPTSGTSGPK